MGGFNTDQRYIRARQQEIEMCSVSEYPFSVAVVCLD
jgi:hypothetical protein